MEKALKAAKKLGMTVSFDLNFRSKLWKFDEARDVLSTYMPYVDVLIGIEPLHLYNKEGGDVKDGLSMQPGYEDMDLSLIHISTKKQIISGIREISRKDGRRWQFQ